MSIVIPSHCRVDLLRRCLDSVEKHAPGGTQVIVVDDGSRAGSVSRAASVFDVQVVRMPRQRGFCVAANTGLQVATAPVVELLNDDTEVTDGWATAALEHFRDKRIAAVAPLVLNPPRPGETMPRIDSAGDRYFIGGVAGKRGHGEALCAAYLSPCPVFGASASSAFYRREAVLRVGCFPERFGAYFEDVDLAFRLQRVGYRAHFEPCSRVLHHGSASYGRPRRRLLETQSRNEELVWWRNLPAGELWRAMPLHLLVLAAKGWRRWQEGNVVPFACGRLRVMGELRSLMRHRRRLSEWGPAESSEPWLVERRF
ncbi:MAG: glycosyltransferase family 2 protein [Planctomycetia bacterium]|nr:glycosyltransferase family 2 protein [Planctomycetia bacterium]